MKKTTKLIISGVIAIIILYLGNVFYNFVAYRHHFDDGNCKRYFWIFKDSVKSDIDTFLYAGYVKRRDVLYHYLYKKKYHIAVWEFKDLDVISLKNTPINLNVNLDDVKFRRGERLNKNGYPSPMYVMKFNFDFNYVLNVNLDNYSKITKNIEFNNYKGFYGNVNKMSFSNRKGEHVILFDYRDSSEPTFFLMYKARNSFFVIMINSEKPFDESIINILNLN